MHHVDEVFVATMSVFGASFSIGFSHPLFVTKMILTDLDEGGKH